VGPEALIALEAALDGLDAPPQRVLDVGTGTGKAARVLARRFPAAEVVGVDLSPAMIERATELVPRELATRVRYEVADASALAFEDGSFDLVVLLNMIPFFEEVARVTALGGKVLFASAFGPETPIYVPHETLRERLGALGFGDFREISAGAGDALLATREKRL
jgi:ubiquinone/menaquinone biosynthesis C-methylase UbiE